MNRAFSTLLIPLTVVFSAWFALGVSTATAATVWSGLTKSFTKAAFADATLPENQDHITPNVALTRASSQVIGDDGLGMYNAAMEPYYADKLISPADTEWATEVNNPSETIAATNWSNLTFSTWRDSYGGGTSLAFVITTIPAVVHLVSDDIYLDLQFTQWGMSPGEGGSFSHLRSVPEPATFLPTVLAILMMWLRRSNRP